MPISLTKFQIIIILEALSFYLSNKDKLPNKQLSAKRLLSNNKTLVKLLKDTLNKVDFKLIIELE